MAYPEQTPQEPKTLPGYFSAPAPPPQAAPAPHHVPMPAPVAPYQAPSQQYVLPGQSCLLPDPASQPLHGVSFPGALGQFFRKYGVFSGRASRGEFWWIAAAVAALALFASVVGAFGGSDLVAGILGMAMLASFVPALAVTVRRLHDANFSGGLAALWLVPYIGFVIVLILVAMPSKPAGARFDKMVPGAPPRMR